MNASASSPCGTGWEQTAELRHGLCIEYDHDMLISSLHFRHMLCCESSRKPLQKFAESVSTRNALTIHDSYIYQLPHIALRPSSHPPQRYMSIKSRNSSTRVWLQVWYFRFHIYISINCWRVAKYTNELQRVSGN